MMEKGFNDGLRQGDIVYRRDGSCAGLSRISLPALPNTPLLNIVLTAHDDVGVFRATGENKDMATRDATLERITEVGERTVWRLTGKVDEEFLRSLIQPVHGVRGFKRGTVRRIAELARDGWKLSGQGWDERYSPDTLQFLRCLEEAEEVDVYLATPLR